VVTNRDHLNGLKFSHSLPYAFTEYGAIMAANVLNSLEAVEMSVFVVRAFVRMREKLTANQILEKRLAEIERKLLLHDTSLRDIYDRIRPLLLSPPEKPKRRIGFTAEENRARYGAGKG
ncbi:MAG TPA: ORF6N domain-containing protein, partial [bacterium]|nr:ORF6N domain-containing protein [bacterium]